MLGATRSRPYAPENSDAVDAPEISADVAGGSARARQGADGPTAELELVHLAARRGRGGSPRCLLDYLYGQMLRPGYNFIYIESRLTKQIYKANVCDGKVGKGRSRKSYAGHIGGIITKGQIQSTRNRRVYMKRLKDVSEAGEICKDRTMWKSVVSAYPFRK
ncbi:hypothetical protein EVAR_64922_1 [Eumeta japonica]|uniref:Uncharacterized protein n=1 Tax=Eumeta variegata TaxID=151549 RepID=A0A4C1ZNM0_EUMVA|nr:hypothetical protein EVAR_64922_1 [Eumeta japonica]